jgi:hypothetical protein
LRRAQDNVKNNIKKPDTMYENDDIQDKLWGSELRERKGESLRALLEEGAT